MAEDLIITAIQEIGKPVSQSIATRIKYLLCFGRTAEELREHVQEMVATKTAIQQRVDAAKIAGEEILPDVEQWLTNFHKVEAQANSLSEQAQNVRCCSIGCSWNFRSGYRLGKEAAERIAEVEKLRRDGNFQVVSSRAPPPSAESRLPTVGFHIFESTSVSMEEAMRALRDKDGNYIIGVYGMGGVGKTALVKEVAKRAVNEGLFANAVMATVSQHQNYRKVQSEIAEGLGLELKGESEATRAAKILRGLNNVLIILDDLWDVVDLSSVGTPSKGGDGKGCKVLITSRFQDVCTRMECDCSVEVKVLPPDDSWNLFKSKAGELVESPWLNELARDVAKECKGLPLALIILGLAMRDKVDVNEWETVLRELRSSSFTLIPGMEAKVFLSIKRSIDFLHEEERLCFLLCCLFPEDSEIDPKLLTMYVMGEGFFRNVQSLKDAEGKVHYILNKLKSSCLLLEGRIEKIHVMMHDVVRDVAIRIASEGTYGFFVAAGKDVCCWPERKEVNECLRISLINSNINALPQQSGCTRLRTLILRSNYRHTESVVIPDRFFQDMESLLVLDLYGKSVKRLPSSYSSLTNLKTLLIRGSIGRNLKDISMIGELKQLERLSLRDASSLSVLPEEIGNLTRLHYLDLSHSIRLRIPPNILSKLSRLEQLYIVGGFDGWQVEGSGDERRAAFTELSRLPCLTHLFIWVRSTKCLSQEFDRPNPWPMLKAFQISFSRLLGSDIPKFKNDGYSILDSGEAVETTRSLAISKPISNWAKTLLNKANRVQVIEWEGVKRLVEDVIPWSAYANLEVLKIDNMPHLENIISQPLLVSTTCEHNHKLKDLSILQCDELLGILSTPDMLSWAHALEDVVIYSCKQAREIFHYDHERITIRRGEEGGVQVQPLVLLPQLEKMLLVDLEGLTSIWAGLLMVPQGSRNIMLHPNLRELTVLGCASLKYLVSPELVAARAFGQLQRLEFRSCAKMEKMIMSSSGSPDHQTETMSQAGPSSSTIPYYCATAAFPNLQVLKVYDCWSLTSLFSWRQAVHDLPLVKRIKIRGCDAMKEIIRWEEDEEQQEMKEKEEQSAPVVMLPRLQYLSLTRLDNLIRFHGGRRNISLPSLETISGDAIPDLNQLRVSLKC